MELVILGSGGGPQPNVSRSAPAIAVVHEGQVNVVDCGNGVARQLARADLALRDLATVWLTHHHIDHTADYGNLVALAWTARLGGPVDAYGPPPLGDVTQLFLDMNRVDIEHREAIGRPPLAPMFQVTEIKTGQVVRDKDGLTVTATPVRHPPLDAYAYRFDSKDRSIVISGDTAPCDAMVELARGADVLVHEAYSPEHLPLLLAGSSANESLLRQHFRQAHTSAAEAARVATEARVGTLVLWHLIPTEGVTDEEWLGQAREHFDGDIVVAHDLCRL